MRSPRMIVPVVACLLLLPTSLAVDAQRPQTRDDRADPPELTNGPCVTIHELPEPPSFQIIGSCGVVRLVLIIHNGSVGVGLHGCPKSGGGCAKVEVQTLSVTELIHDVLL